MIRIVVACAALAACDQLAMPEAGLEINVLPLTLPGVVDACYGLEVLDERGASVWSRDAVCAARFGDGRSSLAYVGSCDATDRDGDGVAEATVVLRIEELYEADGADADALPDALADWRNPCAAPHAPEGCRIKSACEPNADTRVAFDLVVMRQATQGFFDVAVSFEDVFCSAKVDCVGRDGAALELVHDPASGERVPSVVVALACTDGDADAGTHLYMDDVVLACPGGRYEIDPSAGPGNLYPGGDGAPAPLAQAIIFQGHEAGAAADLLYWNVALGIDPAYLASTSGTCRLETRASASSGALDDGETPPGTNYPYVVVDVALSLDDALICGHHPIDGAAPSDGVRTAYTGALADGTGFARTRFGHMATRGAGGVTTSALGGVPAIDPCVADPSLCAPPPPPIVPLMFVGEYTPNLIRVFPLGASGDVAPLRTLRGPLEGGVNNPRGLTVANDELYVANQRAGSVLVFDLTAAGMDSPKRIIGGSGTGLIYPSSVDVVGAELIIADYYDHKIVVLPASAAGDVGAKRIIRGPQTGLVEPLEARVHGGWIYVANNSSTTVTVYPLTADGNVAPTRTLQVGSRPVGLVIDDGELIVALFGGAAIRVFDLASGDPIRTISGPDTALSVPYGLSLVDDELYVVDASSKTVLVFPRDADGDVAPTRTLGGPATGFSNPAGLAIYH